MVDDSQDVVGLTVRQVIELRGGDARGVALTRVRFSGHYWQPISFDEDDDQQLVVAYPDRDRFRLIPIDKAVVVKPWPVPQGLGDWHRPPITSPKTTGADLSIRTYHCEIHGSYQASEYSQRRAPIKCPWCAIETPEPANPYNSFEPLEHRIKQAQQAHPDANYDYRAVKAWYTGSRVIVICPQHGPFAVHGGEHIRNKRGCPTCSFARRVLTAEQFVEKARIANGDRYQYRISSDYVVQADEIIATCPEHGEWSTQAGALLWGQKCPTCSGAVFNKDLDAFRKRVQTIHGERYEIADNVELTGASHPIEITCKRHGPFWTTYSELMKRTGCPKCSGLGEVARLLAKIEKNHAGSDYLWDKTIFSTQEDMTVVCKKHGPFRIKANHFARGGGCLTCLREKQRGHRA